MNFESRNTGRSVLRPGREEEVRKRAEARREGRWEPVLKWRDLPWEIFKVEEVQETKGKYGPSRILTLERKGETVKVWACSRMMQELDDIPQKRWTDLKIANHGMKRGKKSGHEYFDFEVVV